jgi:glycerol kinase
MQFQADMLGTTVDRPKIVETTALGAALLAGRGIGKWATAEMLEKARRRDRLFKARMKPERREQLYAGWKRAVNGVRTISSDN